MSPPTNRRDRTRGQLFPTYMPVDQPQRWFLVDAFGTLLLDAKGGFAAFMSEEEALDHADNLWARTKAGTKDDGTP